MPSDPVAVGLLVARLFERLEIPYLIGGSVASTLYGEVRMTLDVDFAVHLGEAGARALIDGFGDDFYLSEESVLRAVRAGTAFNAIHRPSMVKVDVYVRPAEGLFASEIERARPVVLRRGEGGTARVATPEDTVLQKLRWHAAAGGASSQQWRDVLGILKVMGRDLDRVYMDEWAGQLGLDDALARAFEQASP